jgi:hypothetical protein
MFSKEAFARDTTITAQLMEAPYLSSGLAFAEWMVFGSTVVQVQPLVREGKGRLVAVYPCDVLSDTENRLRGNQDAFKGIMDEMCTGIWRNVPLLLDPVARLAGSFARGFVEGH